MKPPEEVPTQIHTAGKGKSWALDSSICFEYLEGDMFYQVGFMV